jgi:hypothetical protein
LDERAQEKISLKLRASYSAAHVTFSTEAPRVTNFLKTTHAGHKSKTIHSRSWMQSAVFLSTKQSRAASVFKETQAVHKNKTIHSRMHSCISAELRHAIKQNGSQNKNNRQLISAAIGIRFACESRSLESQWGDRAALIT